jgi:hypothetical protein
MGWDNAGTQTSYIDGQANLTTSAYATRWGRGQRGHRGRPDDSYRAVASHRFERMPLAVRDLRSKRCSAPGLRPIVAEGPNPYPGLR